MPELSRRTLLLSVPAVLTAPLLAAVQAAPAQAAVDGDDYLDQGFNGLASYVLPGDDRYSVAQGRTDPRPGGVAAGAAGVLRATYDAAITWAVAPDLNIDVPGAAAFAALFDVYSHLEFPGVKGRYQHPFANLSWTDKGMVMAAIDTEGILQGSPLGFGFGTPITLGALASYAEGAVWDPATRRLTGTPIGWERTGYGGVSDGWPELKGYWQGRREVADPDA